MRNKSKFLAALIVIAATFTSCVSVQSVASLGQISVGSVDPATKYQLVQKRLENTKKEQRKARYETVDQAVNAVVNKYNGEYLVNAKVFLVIHTGFFGAHMYYTAEGDVYGLPKK